jgi:hypothetical protein
LPLEADRLLVLHPAGQQETGTDARTAVSPVNSSILTLTD